MGRNEYLAPRKNCPGVQGKLNRPRLYCSLICIDSECLLSLIRYFFSENVNLEALASLCDILFSCACVLFILVAFCDKNNILLYLNIIFSA